MSRYREALGHGTSQENQEAPPPLWAVALNKMRSADGGRVDEAVTLTPNEALAFVEHYLETARRLDAASDALMRITQIAGGALRGY